MKIQHIRNATMIIETNDQILLVDPMLSDKGEAGPPFTLFRFKPKRNPTAALPENSMSAALKSTHCIITHLHPDHLDKKGTEFLKSRQIPITCSIHDEKALINKGLNVVQAIDYWEEQSFACGTIKGIPAVHGYGFVSKLMGKVMGYFIDFPNENSIYLSSDTIYTEDVRKVLTEFKPDISVVACGSAQLDLFKPLLMDEDDIMRFVSRAPNYVIANHMEAVNHCPIKRGDLHKMIKKADLANKIWIPLDGQVRVY